MLSKSTESICFYLLSLCRCGGHIHLLKNVQPESRVLLALKMGFLREIDFTKFFVKLISSNFRGLCIIGGCFFGDQPGNELESHTNKQTTTQLPT